jgi:hypothetical protein
MKTCNICLKEYPLTDFYSIKQKAGNITYRGKCKHCFINIEKNRYYVKIGRKGKYRLAYCCSCQEWKIKSQYFAFHESKCNNCIKKDLETIVEPVIEIVEEHIEEELSPELPPLELETGLTRLCQTCLLEKPVSEFYIKYRIKCKRCVLDHNNKRELELGDGTRWMVPSKVGEYYCEEQRIELFNLMERMGWSISKENVWYKPGFKDEDKNFYIGNTVIKHKEKKKGLPRHTPPRKFTDEEIEDILNKRTMGMTYNEIADIYSSSHTTLRKWVVNYYEKKKDEKK